MPDLWPEPKEQERSPKPTEIGYYVKAPPRSRQKERALANSYLIYVVIWQLLVVGLGVGLVLWLEGSYWYTLPFIALSFCQISLKRWREIFG